MSTIPNETPKVLVVDDNEEFCENVKDILELRGYRTTTTYDGLAALKVVKESPPDLILMDIGLPGTNGLAIFRKIKEIAPQIAVILMTAHVMEGLVNTIIREGPLALLIKPLDFERLFALIQP
jgi:CheY-like chemotaxis protein